MPHTAATDSLSTPQRDTYRRTVRLAVLVYRCLNGSAPGYLASHLQRVSHLNARWRVRSSTTSALVAPRTVRATNGDRTFPAAAASVWNFGTVCRSQYGHRRHCKFFAADWRPSFLPGRTAALTKSVSLHWLPRDFTAIPTCYVSLQS